jgi:nucleoside-diphosphate-sugar epimerase
MRLLLTGATGFVGANAVVRAAAGGADVVAVDLADPHDSVLTRLGMDAARVRWRRGDVTDRAAMDDLVADAAPDAVIHAAAITPGEAEERSDPARTFDVNAGGTLALLEACRRHRVGTFVFLSSTGLYGARPATPPLDEEEPVEPSNLYAIAKLASEHLVLRYGALTGLRARVARVATAYGPLERATSSRRATSSVHRAVEAALAGRILRVAGAEVARDFVYVEDVADALWWLATLDAPANGTYHVGPPEAAPLAIALDALAETVGAFSWIAVPDDDPSADLRQGPGQARAGLRVDRLIDATPWRPRRDLRAGVLATLQEALAGTSSGP